MISLEVLEQLGSLARNFRTATPFRNAVIEDSLEPAVCQRALADFPKFEDRFALNETGTVGNVDRRNVGTQPA